MALTSKIIYPLLVGGVVLKYTSGSGAIAFESVIHFRVKRMKGHMDHELATLEYI